MYRVQCDRTTRSGIAIQFAIECINTNCSSSQLENQIAVCREVHRKFTAAYNINVTGDDGDVIPLELCKVQPLNCTGDCSVRK